MNTFSVDPDEREYVPSTLNVGFWSAPSTFGPLTAPVVQPFAQTPASTAPSIDPDWPLAHRADLPPHERSVSRQALEALEQGAAAVREGRVRTVSAEELGSDDPVDE